MLRYSDVKTSLVNRYVEGEEEGRSWKVCLNMLAPLTFSLSIIFSQHHGYAFRRLWYCSRLLTYCAKPIPLLIDGPLTALLYYTVIWRPRTAASWSFFLWEFTWNWRLHLEQYIFMKLLYFRYSSILIISDVISRNVQITLILQCFVAVCSALDMYTSCTF